MNPLHLHRILWLAGVLLVLSACGPRHKNTAGKTGGRASGFDRYPGSVRFCWGHVNAPGSGHIQWAAFHSTDAPQKVVDHYKKTLGSANLDTSGGDATWRFPKTRATRTLSVSGSKARGPWTRCKAPPSGAQSIIMMSRRAM